MTFSSGFSNTTTDPAIAKQIADSTFQAQKDAIANTAALKAYTKQQNDLYGNNPNTDYSYGTPGGSAGSSGSSGSSLGDFTSASKSATDLAKDMAQFQLGINDQQSGQDQKYRFAEADHTLANTEALNQQGFGFDTSLKQQDFRNNYALAGQQNTANLGLDSQRNAAQLAQLTKQTDTQKDMQQADFGNQTTQRAQAAALAQMGFRGR